MRERKEELCSHKSSNTCESVYHGKSNKALVSGDVTDYLACFDSLKASYMKTLKKNCRTMLRWSQRTSH